MRGPCDANWHSELGRHISSRMSQQHSACTGRKSAHRSGHHKAAKKGAPQERGAAAAGTTAVPSKHLKDVFYYYLAS